jgi:hypothetical protein
MTTEDLKTINAMAQYGGEFVKRLAEAARAADSHNLDRIKLAFTAIWKKYTRFSMITTPDES